MHRSDGRGRPRNFSNSGSGDTRRWQSGANRQNRDTNRPQRRSEAETLFLGRTPLTPCEWIQLEKGSSTLSMRAVDLLTPIGKGQRGLIVAAPKTGKTTILKDLCIAVSKTDPNIKTYCLLIDERPEEVTDFRRSVPCEVFASSSDRPYEEHIRLAESVYQKAIAEAVQGRDALIVVDSLTRLSRVHNTATAGTRTMTGGLDARAMEVPRRFFGAARKIEEGGSLTILATILVETGSKMDEIIFQEFKGTGNMELVLSRAASELRLFPAIHVKNSGTRREELLLSPSTLESVWKLRRSLAGLSDIDATKLLIELLRKYPTNDQLLKAVMAVP